MKKVIIFSLMTLVACVQIGLAEENGREDACQFHDMKPDVSLWGGFTLYDLDGSTQAGEYEYFQDSPSASGEVTAFRFPHRIAFEGDVINENDFFGEARYAYKDLVLSRWISRRLFHNLRGITLVDFEPSTLSPGVDIRDKDIDFGVKTDVNQYSLRLKTPDFPFHLYTEGYLVDRKGTEQHRFLSGSGYFDDVQRASTNRDIDWQRRVYLGGMNTHLGPVELDMHHSEMNFDPGGREVLAEPYSAAGFPPGSIRSAGTFELSRIPELSGSSNTLKLHTDYTGKIFASATLSRTDRKNEFSGAKAEYDVAHGEFLWMPLTKLRFLTKYRYQKTDTSSPDSKTIFDLSNPSNNLVLTNIRPPISSEANTVTGAVRYGPYKGTTVRAEYRHERKERDDAIAEEWHLSNLIKRDIISLSANSRLLKKLRLKAKYTYKDITEETADIALGIEPTSSNEGLLSLSWTPIPKVSTHLQYAVSKKEKNNLQVVDSTGVVVNSVDDRDTLSERFLGSITFLLHENLFLTPMYTYLSNEVDQDLVYAAWPPVNVIVDDSAEIIDKAHNYALNLGYTPVPGLELSSVLSFTKSESRFCPRTSEALEPVSLASFSEIEIEELGLKFQLTYEFSNKWGLGLKYAFTDYDDNSADNSEEGTYHLAQFMISKGW